MIDSEDYSFGQCLNPYINYHTLIGISSFEVCQIGLINFELQEAITGLNPEQPFLSFDLGLTADEINVLAQLHIGLSAG